MKKLMFATALVASAVAFADPLNAISFEHADYANIENATNLSARADKPDPDRSDTGTYFLFEGDSDSSVVTNVGAAFTEKYAAYYEGKTNYKFLALDTEGGTLWRSINELEGNNDQLGATKTVTDGTYLDTLVQFTVTEDEEPTVGSDDKLAIWLGVETNGVGEVTGTNLMVKAGLTDDQGGITEATFKINAAVEAGVWYRLTVKALADITDTSRIPGFQIYLDGTLLTSSTPTLTSAFLELLSPEDMDDSHYADIVAGKYFASLKTAATLQGVGFKGTGAVDEIVWTDDNPFSASGIEFTLTWDEKVTAVSYVLSADMATTNTLTSGTAATIAAGTTGTIELIPTFASGFEFDYVDMGGAQLGLTFAVPTESTNATLVAKAEAPAYPTYIDTTDTTIKGKYDAWKQAVGFDDSSTSTHLNQFLLNVDESATVGDTALEITEIKQNATAGWDITIGCSLDGVGLTGTVGETIVCNGYLAVSYTDDLTGTWTTENIPVTAVDATTGTVTVNVNKANAKFMKVTLTVAPQAAANN